MFKSMGKHLAADVVRLEHENFLFMRKRQVSPSGNPTRMFAASVSPNRLRTARCLPSAMVGSAPLRRSHRTLANIVQGLFRKRESVTLGFLQARIRSPLTLPSRVHG